MVGRNICERISSRIIEANRTIRLEKNIVEGVKDLCFTRLDFVNVVACS
jgi:hypothetical protein